jgi:photosynthetic reaction center H subunit
MSTGAITAHIDVAQVVLYAFWVFFAGLVYYLHRENKREGYPLESDSRGGRVVIQGFPAVPEPKTYRLANGQTRQSPGPNSARQPLQGGVATSPVPGSPIVPVGNPLLAGVGPGAYADRSDEPDTTIDGEPRIVPLRAAPGFSVAPQDGDQIGLPVFGGDGQVAGKVVDLWVDRSEAIFRYIEIEVPTAGGPRRVLAPMTFAKVREFRVTVRSILAAQFAEVPGLRNPDQITSREEDRISAYYAAGTLYAEASRQEPFL